MNVQTREEPASSDPRPTPDPVAGSAWRPPSEPRPEAFSAGDDDPPATGTLTPAPASGALTPTPSSGGRRSGGAARVPATAISGAGLPAIEKYELLEEIGHGGMATVYRARDPRLGREVAVKVIHKHLRENTEVAARFVAEARAAAKLRHPSIVEVHDVSNEEDGERYLVVELLRGCTLRKLLQQHRDLPAEIGAAIVLDLCGALEHAHAAGIIHRDVKPENVLVELPGDRCSGPSARSASTSSTSSTSGSSGAGAGAGAGVRIKLTDFGIAKILDSQGLTSTGQVLGAPEQIEGGEVDARTDVFALGVLMYECLVGHLPFEGKNPAQVLRRVLEGSYPPPDEERPSVGGRWARVVGRALARDPAERPAGPGALGEMIRAELDELGISDARAEIDAYFAEPEAHAAELTRRLVPRLVSRAEAARKRGDVPGAAADLNRALALAPDDLSIFKKVSSLTSSASRRQLARRVGLVLAGSAALGLGAYGVARRLREVPPQLASIQPPTAAPPVEARPVPRTEHHEPAPAPSARVPANPKMRLPRLQLPTAEAAPGPPSTTPRQVVFSIIPTGARLVLDGSDVTWWNRTLSLQPGPHPVEISVPNSKCCKPYTGTVNVAPYAEGVTVPQRVVIKLDILPATVTLAGAPPNAQYTCPAIALTGFAGGGAKTVTLPDVIWSGRCEFVPLTADAETRSATVTLRAGEPNTIPWPAAPN